MSEIRFAKYHGIGNDFVMIADLEDRVALDEHTVRRICDRRFGIGGDGVIRVAPGSGGADFFMDYSNSDGSIGEMCGNGIRCLFAYARDEGLTDKPAIVVGTRSGLKTLEMTEDGRVRVDMGPPSFAPDQIPVLWDGQDALHAKIELDDEVLEVACVSMGNPHAVLTVPDPRRVAVASLGPRIETHPAFPRKANVEFMAVEAPDRVAMRVWERGSGETLACGTGACAVAVVARLLEGTDESVTVILPGGSVEVEWHGSIDDPATVYMTGPAVRSFSGTVDPGTLVEAPA